MSSKEHLTLTLPYEVSLFADLFSDCFNSTTTKIWCYSKPYIKDGLKDPDKQQVAVLYNKDEVSSEEVKETIKKVCKEVYSTLLTILDQTELVKKEI